MCEKNERHTIESCERSSADVDAVRPVAAAAADGSTACGLIALCLVDACIAFHCIAFRLSNNLLLLSEQTSLLLTANAVAAYYLTMWGASKVACEVVLSCAIATLYWLTTAKLLLTQLARSMTTCSCDKQSHIARKPTCECAP